MPKILILEDDFHLAQEWKVGLETNQFEVDHIASAADLDDVLLSNEYCFFIIDLYQVQKNRFQPDGGISCISKIKKHCELNNNQAKIIAITGFYVDSKNTNLSTEQKVKDLGADILLRKPLTIEKMLKAVCVSKAAHS